MAGEAFSKSQVGLSQSCIPAIDLRSDRPAIDGRGDLEEGKKQGEERNDHDLRAIDDRCEPKRKKAIEKGRSVLEKTPSSFVQGEVEEIRGRELAWFLEEPARLVDGFGRAENQGDQCGVKVLGSREQGGRCQESPLGGGLIAFELIHALAKDQG